MPCYTLLCHRFEILTNMSERKREDFINFGLDLDVTKFLVSGHHTSFKYELTNVINHFGDLDSGHYTSFCKRNNR